MVEALREATDEYEIGSSAEIDEDSVVELTDVESAVELLRPFVDDPDQMVKLRRLLEDEPLLGQWSDDQVVSAIAVRLVDGRLSIGELSAPVLYSLPTSAAEAPPPPPPTRQVPRSAGPTTAMLTVSITRVDGEKLAKPATVTLSGPSGGSKQTDGSDVAIFSGLAPGDYKVKVKLSDAEKTLELEDQSFRDAGFPVTLAAGDTRSCSVRVHPPAALQVIVVGADGEPLLGDVAVTTSGPTAGSGGTGKDTGSLDLADLLSGTYSVSLTLPEQHGAKYAVPKTLPQITLSRGQKGQLRIVLPERPEPTIKIDDPKIVLVRHKYLDDASLGAKPHRIPVTLGVQGEFDGTGQLTCSAADQIKAYATQDGTDEIALPATIKAEQLKKGHVVFIEGQKASASVGATEIKLELKGGSVPPKQTTASEKITCVKLQIDAYKSRPEDGSDPTALTEDEKIKPGRHIVLQGSSNDRLFAERSLIVVKQAEPNDFAGKLVLKPRTGNVALFAANQEVPAAGQAALADAALKIDNATIDAAKGQRFWAQGQTKSGALGDTGLVVELESLPGAEGDRITMTVLKLELRLHKSRTDLPTAGDPTAFSDDEKMNVGRFLHVQDTDNHHGRALLKIAKVEPNGFTGTLVLSAFDAEHSPAYSSTKSNASKVELYADEIAAGGQAATALGQIDHPANFPADGKSFWVQGKTVSAALRDTELRLGVNDVDKGAERVAFSVVQFKKLTVDTPSTPANTVRASKNGGPSNSPVKRHELIIGNPPAPKSFDEDPATNAPLVLVEASVKDADRINLKVEIEPASPDIPVRWGVVRDRRPGKGDHADIIALAHNSEDPGLVEDRDKLKATLTANAVGTFHICPFVDQHGGNTLHYCDDTGKRIDREPYMMLNLVLVRVQCMNNLSVANSAAGGGLQTQNLNCNSLWPTAGVCPVPTSFSNGDFNGNGNDAAWMEALVRVIGGGQDGKLGLDRVFCAWANNELDCPTSPSPGGKSEDVTHHHRKTATSPLLRLRCFWRLDGVEIGGPVLDGGGTAGADAGTGGATCTSTNPTVYLQEPTKTDDPSGIGQQWQQTNWDSPGGGVSPVHPNDGTAWLRRFTFNIDFRCALLFWTNIHKIMGPDDSPACRLYSSVQTNTWNIRYEATFAAKFVVTEVTPHTVTMTNDPDSTRRATPIDGSGFETRLPRGLTVLQADRPF
jgi:hypothetical protein